MLERIHGAQVLLGQGGGRRLHYMNDLSDKLAPLTQAKFDKLFPSMANTVVNGVYAMEHLPASVRETLPHL